MVPVGSYRENANTLQLIFCLGNVTTLLEFFLGKIIFRIYGTISSTQITLSLTLKNVGGLVLKEARKGFSLLYCL